MLAEPASPKTPRSTCPPSCPRKPAAGAARAPLALPSLPRVSFPDGAVAQLRQASRTVAVPLPAGMPANGLRTSFLSPANAGTTKALWSGWLSLRCVVACESPGQLAALLAAEEAELLAEEAADCSAPPRRLSVSLLCSGLSATNPSSKQALDALAAVATHDAAGCPAARLVRFQAFAGPQADAFLAAVSPSAQCAPRGGNEVEVAVRWARDGAVQAAFFSLPTIGHADAKARAILDGLYSTATRFGFPLPGSALAAPPPIQPDLFSHSIAAASASFFDRLVGPVAISLSPRVPAAEQLVPCGALVRFANRASGERGFEEVRPARPAAPPDAAHLPLARRPPASTGGCSVSPETRRTCSPPSSPRATCPPSSRVLSGRR